MDCQKAQDLLSAYIDNDLSAEDRHLVEEHLAVCARCRDALNQLLMMKEAFRSLPLPEIPHGFHERIMNAVRDAAAEAEKQKAPAEPVTANEVQDGGKKRFRGLFAFGHDARRWVHVLVASILLVVLSSAGTLLYVGHGKWPDLAAIPARLGDEGAGRKMEPREQDLLKGQVAGTKEAPGAIVPSLVAPPGTGGAAPEGAYEVKVSEAQVQQLDRKIVRTAHLSVEVARGGVERASQEAVQIVDRYRGYVESSTSSASEKDKSRIVTFYMMARVPKDSLDSTVKELSGLGKIIRRESSAQDVTGQYIDLDARLRSKEVQEERLLKILGQAKTVGELLQVEGELNRVRGDIESMKRQKDYYDKVTSMSSLSLTISEEGAAKPGPLSAWQEIWMALLNAWKEFLIFIARKTPVIAIAAAVIFFGLRLISAVRRA